MSEDDTQTGMPDPVDRHVGLRIGQRRREVGLSRRALGELIGIGLKQVNKYETAANRVSAGRLFDIGTALGVPPTYFFEGLADSGSGARRPSAGGLPREALDERREVRILVDSYHTLAPDLRTRFLRLVRSIGDGT